MRGPVFLFARCMPGMQLPASGLEAGGALAGVLAWVHGERSQRTGRLSSVACTRYPRCTRVGVAMEMRQTDKDQEMQEGLCGWSLGHTGNSPGLPSPG